MSTRHPPVLKGHDAVHRMNSKAHWIQVISCSKVKAGVRREWSYAEPAHLNCRWSHRVIALNSRIEPSYRMWPGYLEMCNASKYEQLKTGTLVMESLYRVIVSSHSIDSFNRRLSIHDESKTKPFNYSNIRSTIHLFSSGSIRFFISFT